MMKRIPLILLGAGGVGRALLEQLVSGRANTAQRNQMQFDVVAIADSKKWLFSADGLADATILELVNRKKSGQSMGEDRPTLTEMLNQLFAHHPQGIFVDVTATDGTEIAIDYALNHNWSVALANKKPFALPFSRAQNYFHNPRVRHESTVGGGQPVISTMRYLRDTNDPIFQIEGQLSGTLGYLCQRLDEGTSFSQAVAEAKAKGYTEPDPRDDLGGMDVMRKLLIMGRLAGWPLEAGDIEVESLYPSALAHLTVPEFMSACVALDPSMRDRVANAHVGQMVLRYVGEVGPNGGRVGLKAVPQASALANLKYIRIRTGHYDDEALMICGKGAGVGMTAAGVVGDLIDLGREQF